MISFSSYFSNELTNLFHNKGMEIAEDTLKPVPDPSIAIEQLHCQSYLEGKRNLANIVDFRRKGPEWPVWSAN